jgi:hypothetical protein
MLSRLHHRVGRGNRSNIYGADGPRNRSILDLLSLVTGKVVAVLSQCFLTDLVR